MAKRLGYHYVDQEMVKEVAEKVGVSPEEVRGFEKSGSSAFMEFLDKIVSKDFVERILSGEHGYLDGRSYVPVVKDIIEHLYTQGNMIIMEFFKSD